MKKLYNKIISLIKGNILNTKSKKKLITSWAVVFAAGAAIGIAWRFLIG